MVKIVKNYKWIVTISVCALLTLIMSIKVILVLNFTDSYTIIANIESIIITDGRTGYKEIITDSNELKEISNAIKGTVLIPVSEPDSTGYTTAILIKTNQSDSIFIYDYNRVSINNKKYTFKSDGDMEKFKRLISVQHN